MLSKNFSYSLLSRFSHFLLLNSKIIRDITFKSYSFFLSKKIKESNINDNHIFITGMARSGSTMLLNFIHDSGEYSSLGYDDVPFVMAPGLQSTLSFNQKINAEKLFERAHGDGVMISKSSPEAFEEVFWSTYDSSDEDIKKLFTNYIALINFVRGKNKYLSKNNQNIKRIETISSFFPNSKILIPFRNPLDQSVSLLNQHKKFIKINNKNKFIRHYMKLIGHTEFGPEYKPMYLINKDIKYKNFNTINHWLEQWRDNYSYLYSLKTKLKNVYFISYDKFISDKYYAEQIFNLIGIKNTKFKLLDKTKNKNKNKNKYKSFVNEKLLKDCMDFYRNFNN